MYAIIKNGGKQFKIRQGDIVKFDKMGLEPKEKVEFNEVLALEKDGKLQVGVPFIDGVKVEASVINEGKARKIVIFKKRRRKDSKLKKGFRRSFTRIRITKIA